MTRLETMTNPLFSIITVTLNNLEGLQKTHDSLVAQNNDHYKWIVIDGGSTDGTIDYLDQSYVHHISEPDHGIYDAMNKGLKQAKGNYIIFMNAGDCFANKSVLDHLQRAAEADNPDFIYGDALEITDNVAEIKKSRHHTKIKQGMFTHHQAMIYKTDKLDGLQYNTAYKIAADYDFTLRFLKNCESVSYLPEPLCLFQSGGISQQQVFLGRKEQYIIRKEAGISPLYNIFSFTGQSAVYALRKLCPKLYWILKRG